MAETKTLFIAITLLLLTLTTASAQVVIFDQYSTTATVDDGTIHIERDVRIKNTGQTPIIPGELHFRLYEQQGDDTFPILVNDFTAESERGESLRTTITERGDETDLSIQLWNPLLPGFHYAFTMRYTMAFEPSGILFYEIKLPREETTIPITNEQTRFMLSNKYHVTYAPESNVNKLAGNTVVSWEDTGDTRIVEYSRLPLPKIPVRAVNVFWIVIIILLIAVFVFSLKNQGRRKNSGGGTKSHGGQYWQTPPMYPPRGGGQG